MFHEYVDSISLEQTYFLVRQSRIGGFLPPGCSPTVSLTFPVQGTVHEPSGKAKVPLPRMTPQ